jgi:hypothetical protein
MLTLILLKGIIMFDFTAMKDAAENLEKFMRETDAKLGRLEVRLIHLEDLIIEISGLIDNGEKDE